MERKEKKKTSQPPPFLSLDLDVLSFTMQNDVGAAFDTKRPFAHSSAARQVLQPPPHPPSALSPDLASCHRFRAYLRDFVSSQPIAAPFFFLTGRKFKKAEVKRRQSGIRGKTLGQYNRKMREYFFRRNCYICTHVDTFKVLCF